MPNIGFSHFAMIISYTTCALRKIPKIINIQRCQPSNLALTSASCRENTWKNTFTFSPTFASLGISKIISNHLRTSTLPLFSLKMAGRSAYSRAKAPPHGSGHSPPGPSRDVLQHGDWECLLRSSSWNPQWCEQRSWDPLLLVKQVNTSSPVLP